MTAAAATARAHRRPSDHLPMIDDRDAHLTEATR